MGTKSEEIKRHIDTKREELGQNVQALEDRVRDITNWRLQFHKHTFAGLGAAFGVGLWLSRVGK